jgi:RNase P subunit RPR2
MRNKQSLEQCSQHEEMISSQDDRVCHDCTKPLPYGHWVEIRCTLDNEDDTQAYCYDCLVKRMTIWLRDQWARSYHQ